MNTEVNTEPDLEATLDRIMRDLDVDVETFPEQALREAQRYRHEITPRLIEAIRSATSQAAAGHLPDGNVHWFAAYLLTEFRATGALPALLEAISLPGDLSYELFGDAITEDLTTMLAVLAHDAPELLDGLISNRALDRYVRGAAIGTFLLFVRDARMTREHAIEHLRIHLREAIEQRDEDIADSLIVALNDFAAAEAREEIQEAYRLRIVDTSMIGLKSVEAGLARGDAQFQQALERCRPTQIDDAVEYVRKWFVRPGPSHSPVAWDAQREIFLQKVMSDVASPDFGTVVHSEPRVGRNDPCPCGSGKKFKKCCGGR